MLPNQFTPSFQVPMRDQEKQKSKPAINIPSGIDNLSFDKMPTLGANLDLSRSFEFCAMNIKGGFQNSFYNQWEADVDDLEERKILEDLKGGSRVGCYGDTKEEGSLFQRDRFNAAYSTNDKNFSEQNEFFPAESKDTAPKTQDNADFRRMPRAVAVQEVETHGIFNAGRKREASQKRSLRVITNPPHDNSPALGHVEKMMIPVRQHSLAETVNSEFIQGPIPDKDSGTKSSRSDFGKDERQGTAENEHKTKGNEQKESERGQHQTMNRHAARNDPIIEGRQQDSREGRRESEERIVELIGNDGGDLELRVLQRRQEEFLKKTNNVQFNVMIVGATGLGKSTFIDALLNKNYAIQPSIKMSTREIIERQGVKTHKDINFKITLIDTPGYKNGEDLNVWFKTIEKYITSQFKRYKTAKDKLKITKRDENTIEDKRVHALLYFVSGPRISQVDLDNMMKLQEYCNIIPILAKGDNYTAPEIKEIKKTFLEQALKKIKFFDFDEVLKDNPRKLSELKEGKFGPCPPFLIISSAKRIEISPGRFVYGRQYPWGTCNIENPEHSDFVLLQTLLGGHICLEAIEMTGYYYKDFIKKLKKDKQKKQEEKDANAKIGVGVAAVIGLAAFLGWKKSLF